VAAAVADGHLWLIPAVGHMPAQDLPDEFNRRVLEILEPFRRDGR
jgi:pimeloyl-ACP methyl ester carboxylesterase